MIESKDYDEERDLTLRLLRLLENTDYELVQENGQRRLTAPEIAQGVKHRSKGAEIFLGRLPRDCYEDEIMPILSRVGRLMELRLMLDFSGSTRGYAFALFEDPKIAKKACSELDGYMIRPGHRIGVVMSVDNCRLFFGGVPKNKTKAEFMDELTKILDGIVDIFVYPNAQDKSLNRGFIFVEFKDHRAAAMARRKLIPGRVMLWEHEIAVDWAEPEPGEPIDDEIMETVTALFVRNLSLDVSQQKIRDTFQGTTGIPIVKLKKINHFAFVHYETRAHAQTALEIMSHPDSPAVREGWEIRWAKPTGTTKAFDRNRCITEASSVHTTPKIENAITKKEAILKHAEHEESPTSRSSNHMDILRTFVKHYLNAVCNIECLQAPDKSGFVCNIYICKGCNVIFQYYGQCVKTKQKAISVSCVGMHKYLCNSLIIKEVRTQEENMLQP